MKTNVFFSWFTSCVFLFTSLLLHADGGYYKTTVGDLLDKTKQKNQSAAMKQGVSPWMRSSSANRSTLDIRIPSSAGQCFIALPTKGRSDNWRAVYSDQKDLEVAFHLNGNKPISGIIDLWISDTKMQAFQFTFDPSKAKPCTQKEFEFIRQRHYQRLSDNHFPGTAWFQYQIGEKKKDSSRRNWRDSSLVSSFDIFSGGRAISENLALDKDLILAVSPDKKDQKNIPISNIKGVTVKPIDWSDKLPKGDIPIDPLSLAIPIDQHALFAPSLKTLFALMAQIENDGSPMIQAFTVRNPFRNLPSRYKAQMGLDVPETLAKLMPIQSVAITGGDPFFPMGTDVAVIFESKQPEALFKLLSKNIELKAKQHKATSQSFNGDTNDINYIAYQSPDRQFSSHLIRYKNLVAVSNSQTQIKRLLAVQKKTVQALGSSDEFKFFRHRYPMSADETAFIFLSDAAIRRWSSPQVRIGASRRTRSAAALSNLTSRVINGKPLTNDYEPLLGKTFVLGKKVLSERMGVLGFLTPVSEMNLSSVSKREADAYKRWRQGYETGWAQFFDPIAIQLKLTEKTQQLDITVLPLTIDSDYNDLLNLVGNAQLSNKAKVVPSEALLYAAIAIDTQGDVFKHFDHQVLEMLPGLKINPLSWVGESISVYVENGVFWQIAEKAGFNEHILSEIPLAVRIESKSRMKLALFLTALKGMIDTSAPDLVRYEKRKHGDHSYVAVIGDEKEINMPLNIYYAALPSALLISLDEDILKRAIDREYQDVSKLKNLPTARHFLIETNPQFLMKLSKLANERSLEQQRQLESWKAIPILNEWHRRFPNVNPTEFHRLTYASDIYCPGGKGYQWNEKDMTMESVAYGHPTAPRNNAAPIPWLNRFNNLQTSFGFKDGGVRIRAKLEAKKKTTKQEKPTKPTGPLLATAEELSPTKIGLSWTYKDTWGKDNESGTTHTKITRFEKNLVFSEGFFTDQNKKKTTSTMTHARKKDGLYLLKMTSEDGTSTDYRQGLLLLPNQLIKNTVIKSACNATIHTKEGSEEQLSIYTITKVIGLETVTVPAGTFKDCIKIESVSREIMNKSLYTKSKFTQWFAKGVGLVKIESIRLGIHGTRELIKTSIPHP